MPVTPNILLQAAATAKTQAASANTPALTAEPGDKASSFAEVYANQARNKPVVVADKSARPATDNAPHSAGKPDVSNDKAAAPEPAVADSGNSLPADKPAQADDETASDDEPDTADAPDAGRRYRACDPTLDPALMRLSTGGGSAGTGAPRQLWPLCNRRLRRRSPRVVAAPAASRRDHRHRFRSRSRSTRCTASRAYGHGARRARFGC